MRLVRIVLGVILIVVGSILGDGYKNSLYLLWLSSSAFLIIYSEFIMSTLSSKSDEIELLKSKITTLSLLKENSGSIVQMSVFPKDRIIVSQEAKVDLFVTCAIPFTVIPDIKLKTDTQWEVLISNQPQVNKNYAGKYEYILNTPLVTKIDEKFIKYSFYIKINSVGQHNFSIELDNGSITGELKNSFMAY